MKRKTIALLQIVGGAGILFQVVSSYPADLIRGANRGSILLLALSWVLAGLAVAGGALLWRGTRLGTNMSLVLQLLQIPRVSLENSAYFLFLGARLAVEIDMSEGTLAFPIELGGYVLFALSPAVDAASRPTVFGVNLVALVAVWQLLRLRRGGTHSVIEENSIISATS